jgi:hypothetical protein
VKASADYAGAGGLHQMEMPSDNIGLT